MEDNDRVVDSRSSDAGRTIRRRRLCLACHRRFTTYEKTQDGIKLSVIKKDQTRVPYDREKVLAGLEKACYKRSVSAEYLQRMIDRIEEYLVRHFEKEVSSQKIGEQAMRQLRAVDKIAYIRFVSIYRNFDSARDFIEEVGLAIEQTEPLEQLKFFEQ